MYDNYSKNSPTGANVGNCRTQYANNVYHSHVSWTKFRWLDKQLLRVDNTDHTYATQVAGSSLLNFGFAKSCKGNYQKLGEVVLDLRGTAYKIEGVSSCSGQVASGSVMCGQWKASGWRPAIQMACTDNNQRCVVNCGGYAGQCKLDGGYLQLAPV